MGYRLTTTRFDKYLTNLSETFDIYAPVVQKGKGMYSDTEVVGYGKITCFDEIVFDKKSYYSPKEVFYPIRETLFYFLNDELKEAPLDIRPIILFVRPCDINGIMRLDTMFLENGGIKDYYYLRRRQLLKFIMIECTEGFDTCFCVSMGTNKTDQYDGVIRVQDEKILFDTDDEKLLTSALEENPKEVFTPRFIEENKVKVTIPEPDLVTKDVFEHEIWTEYTQRCIACGRCNTSCITCSCFTMQDVKSSDNDHLGERRRVWAGCHVDGFTDMAGGHSFRSKNGEKMRFKTMHKINDYYKRFGTHMCVGCGRCDDVCPEYISFSKCINKLNDIISEGGSND